MPDETTVVAISNEIPTTERQKSMTFSNTITRERTGIHELKCWPDSFNPVWRGEKRAELRVADRDYREGDLMWLREWEPGSDGYTGAALLAQITHVHEGGKFGLAEGHVMLSLKVGARNVNVDELGWDWGGPLNA